MAMKGNGIFLVYTDIDPKFDEEFNAWYNTEHLGELLSLPGFLDAARYVAEKGGPKYLAVYELTSADALKTAEFQKWRANPSPWSRRISPTVIGKNFTRILGQQIFPTTVEQPERGMAPALQSGLHVRPRQRGSRMERLVQRRVHSRLSQSVWGSVRPALSRRRGETRYTTVYEFEHAKVSESTQWNQQRETSSPNSNRMREVMTHAPGRLSVSPHLPAISVGADYAPGHPSLARICYNSRAAIMAEVASGCPLRRVGGEEVSSMSTQTVSYIEAIEHLPKGAILRLPHVSWEDYDQLLADLGDDYHVRVSYACGWLEIMSPLPEHGEFAEVVQDIAREITRELGVKLEARGSMTIRSAWQAKGAEPEPVSMCRTLHVYREAQPRFQHRSAA